MANEELNNLRERVKKLECRVKEVENSIDRNIKGLIGALLVVHTDEGSFKQLADEFVKHGGDLDAVETARQILARSAKSQD